MAEKGFVQRAKDLIWWGGHSENSVKSQQDVNSKNKPERKDTRTTGQTPSQGSPLSPQVGQPKRTPGSVHSTAAVPTAQANALTKTPQYSLSYDQVTVDYQTRLGMGSFGRVYKAVYQGKPCAVKIFNKEVDIEKEVEVISQIHHKNIVRVYGWWKGEGGDGKAALVMELCSTNLKSFLDNKKMQNNIPTMKVKLTILHQITSAMIYLHSQNIVHGDLSAANVLLQLDGPESSQVLIVKVADFGQSRVLNPEALKRLTTTHGNSDVMPPEVLNQGKHELTILVDVFSFGCLIAYVGSCVYPAPDRIRGSEFEKRQKYLSDISDTQSRILLPLMKKCLDNDPYSRGTFEDVAKILAPSLNKYCSEGVSETEEEKTREIERLKSKIEKQSRIYEQLKTEKAVIEAAQVKVEEKAASLQETVNNLQSELDDYKSGNSQLRKDNAKMEELKRELQVLKQANVGEVFDKYQKLSQEKEKADIQNKQLVERETKLQREYARLEKEVNTLKGELQTKRRELGTTTRKRDELTQSLTFASTSLKDTTSRCAGLQGEVDKLNGECGKLKTERDKLKAELTGSQNKEKLTKEQLKRSKEDYTSAQKKVVSLEAEVKSLNEKLHKKTTSFSSVNKDKNMWMKKYDDEARRSENLKREVGKTNEEVVDLKDKNKQLQSDLKSASNERDKFERETERLKEDVFRTGKERDRLQSRLENKLEDLKEKEEEIWHLKNKVEELAKQTSEGKGELDDKATENESLKKELEEKKAEYDRVQGLYVAANKEKEARGQQIKERDEQLTEKQSDLESKQEHIDSLKRKMSAEEESYARLLNECYQLKETKQILEDELKEAKQKLEDKLKKVKQELTASLESREKLENIRRNNAITYKDQCNRIQALADAVDASKMLNKAAEQVLAEECDVHQAMKVDLIHAHKELRLAKKCLQDYHKRMWDFVGKSRNLEHVNEELEEYKAEMERQQTILRDLAAEKAVKELTESYRHLLDRHERLEAEHKQCGQLAKRKRELQLKEEKLRKEKKRLLEKESVTKEVAKELRKELLERDREGWRVPTPGNSNSYSEAIDGTTIEEGLVVPDDRKELLEEIAKLRAQNQELESLLNEFKRQESMQSHSPVVKASKEGWVKERSFLSIKLQRWSQAYFCVQRYPFFIHDFRLRELHSPSSSAQQYMLLPVVQSDVKPLDLGSVKDALGLKTDAGVTRLSISELITGVLEAAVQGLHLSLSATFYLFQRNITVCRFRIITASNVLVRDENIHHNPEEGGAIPRAFFVCSLVDVNEDAKPADIVRSAKGTYYLTEVRGQGEQFAPFFRSKLRKEEGPIAVVTQHLDEILARHVDDQYRAFAKPLAMISEPHRL